MLTTDEEIRSVCLEANAAPECAGLVLWMHTFSPARMWIGGLSILRKPFAHLHTQFNRDLPWDEIDMDFMNLNQAAHGDREAGFLHARMRLPRKIVVGHWEDPEVRDRLGAWMRVARAWQDLQGARFARFGDNMRRVAVTEGDKVAAEARFGYRGRRIRRRRPRRRGRRRGRRQGDPPVRRVRRALRGRARAARAAGPATSRCATRRGSSWACGRSSRGAASRASRPPSRTCTACASCRASPSSGSWPTATASARRATGRPARSFEP